MTGQRDSGEHRERLQKALLGIQKLQRRVAELERESGEPVAVIGIAGRFPGAPDVNALWKNLIQGVDAIGEVPSSRFPVDRLYDGTAPIPGKMYTRFGGFTSDVDRFDPQFFGISPREAVGMDPQHRMFLEAAWCALEDAGVVPGELKGSRTGVFVGISQNEYSHKVRAAGLEALDAYHITGSMHAFVAGRLSFALGLQGPSLAVDTACSSSLTATYLAWQNLRARTCDMAIAGGVNVLLEPDTFVAASNGRMLSSDGRCRAFDAAASGFGRGEGCGAVVLKRLSDAVESGDPILAVLRGVASNQDGASSGITVPNRFAQEQVIGEALRMAEVAPRDVGYIEAHGTGTPLGDPIEMRALGAVLSRGRPSESRFLVGSVKSNIGHLEAAAGIAGLIKAVLSVHHGQIPPHLHFCEPSPHIPWDEIPVEIPTKPTPWPQWCERRIAGVSSFGASGTNVHVVIENWSEDAPQVSESDRPLHVFTVSGRSAEERDAQAGRYRAALLENPNWRAPDVAHTANAARTHFTHRLAMLGESTLDFADRIGRVLDGEEVPGSWSGEAFPGRRRKIAFLYTGQGAQHPGMSKGLYEHSPVYRAAIDQCADLLSGRLDVSLQDLLFSEETGASRLDESRYAQPATFALQVALTSLWRSWGVEPSAVMGHSTGEYAAACVAGVMSLADGLALISRRGELLDALAPGGGMVSVRSGLEAIESALLDYRGRIGVAALNGPVGTVISGERAALDEFVGRLTSQGLECRSMRHAQGFHSHLVEPALAGIERAFGGVSLGEPEIPYVSCLTGASEESGLTDPTYWSRHTRETVRFAEGIGTLGEAGCDVFVEIGPHPVLVGLGQACAPEGSGLWLPSLRREGSDWTEILSSLATLHVAGVEIDWKGVDQNVQRRKVRLPGYPFRGERYWTEEPSRSITVPAKVLGTAHPLLGSRVSTAGREQIFQSELSVVSPSFLRDHRPFGQAVVPAAAFLEMAVAAARQLDGHATPLTVEDVVFQTPLVLPEKGERVVQVVLTPESDGGTEFRILSLDETADEEADSWTLHVTGRLENRPMVEPRPVPEQAGEEGAPVEPGEMYEQLASRGLDFGPSFRGLVALRSQPGQAVGKARLPEEAGASEGYHVHPALLDACLQTVGALLPESSSVAYLPVGVERMTLFEALPSEVYCRARARAAPPGSDTVVADLSVLGPSGQVILLLDGVSLRPAPAGLREASSASAADLLYDLVWQAREPGVERCQNVDVDEICESAWALVSGITQGRAGAHLAKLLSEMDRLSYDWTVEILRELGWSPGTERSFAEGELRERLGVVKRCARLFHRMLEILAEDGALRPAGDEWTVIRDIEADDPRTRLMELIELYPTCEADLRLMLRCGDGFADTLRGRIDPLDLLFPGGSIKDTERLYRDSPLTKGPNRVLGEVVRAAAARLRRTGPIRILEVGGGTGGTMAHVLPEVPEVGVEYVFTDVSPLFVERAKERYADHPFVRLATLDLEADPVVQGFDPNSFDLVIGGNVLHATRDLRATVRRVRKLLKPGGLLALVEGVEPYRYADLTVGLTDGWWSYTDVDLRDYPLIRRECWIKLLAESGFEDSRVASGPIPIAHQAVLLARAGAADAGSAAGREPQVSSGVWLILADDSGVAEAVEAGLVRAGKRCVLAREREADIGAGTSEAGAAVRIFEQGSEAELIAEATDGNESRTLEGVVDLRALDAPILEGAGASDALDRVERAQSRVMGGVLGLAQAVVRSRTGTAMWLVTRGTQAAGARDVHVDPTHAPLWGFAQVLASEHPEVTCRCVDLDFDWDPSDGDTLVAELLSPTPHTQIALRPEGPRVAKVERWQERPPALAIPGRSYELFSERPGQLDALKLREIPPGIPGDGEVEVEVLATGLGFRDVLNALGEYPGGPVPLGGEFSGIVRSLGPNVSGLRPGDAVMGMTWGAFRSSVVASASSVVPKPDHLSFVEAATIPSAFLTAYHALVEIADLGAGERVLIHAAAGGVGLAAVQLARLLGAEVFATAGSPEKRSYLRSLGVTCVMDSRSLAFASEISERTDGLGIDVILNSLSGDFIPSSLSAAADGGRFVELGKRDVWSPEQVAELRPDVAYSLVDLGHTFDRRPERAGELFEATRPMFESGDLRPLPFTCFPMDRAPEAFRHMAQARHIGKIVLTRHSGASFDPDSTFMITGGLGGLGLAVASWMVRREARNIVLVGRTDPDAEQRSAIAALEDAGCRVVFHRADVAEVDQVRALLERVRSEMPPLRGIVHAALVLDDGIILQQTWQRFQNVFRPKVAGTFILDALTDSDPLDFLVVFASAVGLLGSAGQSNYTAANAYVEAFIDYRRARGRPAVCIEWGPWTGVGAAVNRDVGLMDHGLLSISPGEGLRCLEEIIRQPHGAPHVIAMRIDWGRYLAENRNPLFANVRPSEGPARDRTNVHTRANTSEPALRSALDAAVPTRRRSLLLSHVRKQARRVLGLDGRREIDGEQPLQELGLDSLMAVELRSLLAAGLELPGPLPATIVFDHPTVNALAEYIQDALYPEDGSDSREGREFDEADLSEIAALTDESAEAELLVELDRESGGRDHGLD